MLNETKSQEPTNFQKQKEVLKNTFCFQKRTLIKAKVISHRLSNQTFFHTTTIGKAAFTFTQTKTPPFYIHIFLTSSPPPLPFSFLNQLHLPFSIPHLSSRRSAMDSIMQDVKTSAPHYETRVGKRKWNERMRFGEKNAQRNQVSGTHQLPKAKRST